MKRNWLWSLAKGLEGVGLLVVLVGLVMSVDAGMRDQGLESMRSETLGLVLGGALFLVGWLMERAIGARS